MTDIKEQTRLLRQVRLALQNNDYKAAIDSLVEAVQLAHDEGDLSAEGRHLGNLALIYYRLGQSDTALQYFEAALMRARMNNDRVTEDGLLGNMGNILREQKRFQEAIVYLNQALLIAQEIGDVRGRGIWLGNLGLVYDDLGQPKEAIPLHQQAVGIARELVDMRGLASRLGNLGNSYISAGDFTLALQHFEESASLYEQIGERRELALRLGIMGNLHAEMGRALMPKPAARDHLTIALKNYQRTLEIARELGDRATEAELLRSLGNVLSNLGEFDHAIECFRVAADLFAAFGLQQQAAQSRQMLELVTKHREGTK